MNPIVCVALCTILAVAFLGFIWVQALTEDRHRAERREEADAHRAQVAQLLQRIQAPEHAAAEHTAQILQHEQPRVAAFDNDNSFWEAIGVDHLADEAPE
jgi:hypothetical protein